VRPQWFQWLLYCDVESKWQNYHISTFPEQPLSDLEVAMDVSQDRLLLERCLPLPHLRTETRPVSETLCSLLLFRIRRWTKPKNRVIMTGINHRQNICGLSPKEIKYCSECPLTFRHESKLIPITTTVVRRVANQSTFSISF
jgi:hypothetical protein